MDVRQLRYFSEIVAAKSFTRAADRVRVAQPALGLQIRKLEDELGVTLLHRHSRGVEPTEAGVVLLRHANAILKQIEQARSEVMDLSGPPRGNIVLGITPTVSALLATRLVRTCRDSYPGIALNIFEGLSEEIMHRLDANSLDMGFSYNPGAASAIVSEPLLTEGLYLVGAAGADDPGDKVPFAEVCKRSLILPSRGFGLRDWVEDTARNRDLTVDVAFEVDAVATQRELVEQMLAAGAPIEIVVDLKTDPTTTSGLDWSSSDGPPVKITPGTTALATINVQEVAPIQLVIPVVQTWITGR